MKTTEQDVFEDIRGFYDDDQEAKDEAKNIANLMETSQKKATARLKWIRKRITKAGMDFVLKTLELDKEGKYKESILLKEKHVSGMTRKQAVTQTKWSRIIAKHRTSVGGGYDKGKEYHWAHCKCGWVSEKTVSYWDADKIKCPIMLASFKAKNIPEDYNE